MPYGTVQYMSHLKRVLLATKCESKISIARCRRRSNYEANDLWTNQIITYCNGLCGTVAHRFFEAFFQCSSGSLEIGLWIRSSSSSRVERCDDFSSSYEFIKFKKTLFCSVFVFFRVQSIVGVHNLCRPFDSKHRSFFIDRSLARSLERKALCF